MREINVGSVIASKRREKGITQDELAEYIGVSKASVSKWETGQSYPDITFLPQLASYFNITLDDLMGYSPQMTTEDIGKLYGEFSARFTSEDFDTVLADCRELLKKYYSCYPLVMQMAVLLFNYNAGRPPSEEKSELLREIAGLCERVRLESNNVNLAGMAIVMEGSCYSMLGQPQEVLELLGEKLQQRDMRESLIAGAYTMLGKPERAKAIMQSSCYCSLTGLIDSATGYIGLCMDDFDKAISFFNMTIGVAESTDYENLNPNGALLLYFTGAQLYCMNNRFDEAISLLWKITDLSTKRFFPLKIGGNEYFDEGIVKELFAETEMPTEAPRTEQVVKASILNDVLQNPVFAPLSDNPEYEKIIEAYKRFMDEK